jgi:hypothetical protein
VKTKFLVLYDYGQGGVWAYLLADSADEIRREFPALQVYSTPPEWMKPKDLDALSDSMTVDIADREHPFLAALRKDTGT